MKVTLRYGSGNEITREYPAGTTIGCIVKNPTAQAALGYGNNVQGSVFSVPQSDNTPATDGMVISVSDKACGKAAV